MVKRLLISFLWLCAPLALFAQQDAFRAYLYNNEYDVYLRINFYDQNIVIPGQELYGNLPGFLGKKHNSFCWVITSCEVKSDHEATLQLINDFGSEDLTATLTRQNDSVYILRQGTGNTIKVPSKGKWQKLPKTLSFKRK
jgi:hypothetical protein